YSVTGRPCNLQGDYLPDGALPPPWDHPAPDDWSPYDNCPCFELADLLYCCNQMPGSHISDLMQIWATMLSNDHDPLFFSKDDLYNTIDSTQVGNIPWQSFTVSYNGELGDGDVAPWKVASYDVWYRDPRDVLKSQLSNPDFAKEMDFAPKEIRDAKTSCRWFQNFMSGCWSWHIADQIAENEHNHSATLCPIILGSDKTTVSVAMGQNEYYPLCMSNGLIHNNVCHAHQNGVTLIAFLAIPKTDREHQGSLEFCQFRCNLFHGSLRQILWSLHAGMEEAEIIHFADGHFHRVIYQIGPYIADYPEQVLCTCIVQGWCARCDALASNLDGEGGRQTHELTLALFDALDKKVLWDNYGIVDDIMVITLTSFFLYSLH
ncbi:hypothetical protein L208DRAFT_1298111, partial [Tricholoma matsutake]